MAYLNANIPPIYCKIRREYLYDLKKNKGQSSDCVIFGLSSISGRAILFHCMLPNGAVFYRLPISAFFQKEFERKDVPDMRVDKLELWNCFSYYPSVHCFDWLAGIDGKYIGKDKKWHHSLGKELRLTHGHDGHLTRNFNFLIDQFRGKRTPAR